MKGVPEVDAALLFFPPEFFPSWLLETLGVTPWSEIPLQGREEGKGVVCSAWSTPMSCQPPAGPP